jgi:two-component system, chemotaxis family, CheB/CheR fusion protein
VSLNLPIVGIGASAGGVEALGAFFRAMPLGNGMAFVVVTHLAPDRESILAEILGRATQMPVVDARDGEEIEAQHVYVLPAGAVLTIRRGQLRLRRSSVARERTPIDVFFTSLAEDQAEHAIGIVLSGAGSDGTLGLKAVKENGGLTVAQGTNVTGPRFADMPTSAVAAGFVDLVLPVEDIPERLIAYARNWSAFDPERPEAALSQIYTVLRTRTGHDFSEYKDRSFQRRVQRRMQVLQTQKLEDYAAQLQADPDETDALFRDLLIGVTDFFRDVAAFDALEALVIPKLFEGLASKDEIRVWVPGCSTGEEAYSLAILLREQMDRLATPPKVQLYASDIDAAALTVARLACYPADLVKAVTPERLARFFVHETGRYQVAQGVRDLCIFSSHSVIRDPPFSRLDLISCRNLLIYLKPALQEQVLPVFHYALRPGGYLFLGVSESIARHSNLFVSLDAKHRVFRRRDMVARPSPPLRQFLPGTRRIAGLDADQSSLIQRSELVRSVADTIIERFGPTYVIIDDTGDALYFSAGTGRYLEAAAGPPTRNVVAMARTGLRADLRAALRSAKAAGRRIVRDAISVQINHDVHMIGLTVEPITHSNETIYGAVFTDHGPIQASGDSDHPLRSDSADSVVQQIEQELQETKQRLQSTIEELEAANEEFRLSNEELLSVNEELQSSNEELESSKEELQSVNEELQTVNSELANKIEELDRSNSDLNNLFQSTQIATIFLDRNLVIRSFTSPATKLFNLIPGDRGRPLTDLVGHIAYPELEKDIRTVSRTGETIERSISLASEDRHYLGRILPYRHRSNIIDGVIVTFVDISGVVAAEEQQKVLAAELSHRVKNMLTVVSSIARRTLPESEVKDELIGRFEALGHTHDVLLQDGWTKASLRGLISTEIAPYTRDGEATVTVRGPPVMLKPNAALLMALVIHELTTNAVKYGALSTAGGRVEVAWSITGEAPASLELTWAEHGGPKVDSLPKQGFGTELIERGIRFELEGEAKLETADGGLYCRISIPAKPQYLAFVSPSDRPEPEAAA